MESKESSQIFSNKFSMGKFLRKKKNLYKPEPEFSYIIPTPTHEALFSYLKSNGFLSSKVTFAEFSLKNGLHYSGLIATEDILTNEVFIKVPKKVILTTRTAFLSELNVVFLENEEAFKRDGEFYDYFILIFFLLFEFQKGKTSEFFFYISSFPKDQGYLSLWQEKDLEFLEEESLKKFALKEFKETCEEFELLSKIAAKYPKLFEDGTFSLENFLWIGSILTNRSFFGRYRYMTLMPFADMLNHNCVNILRKHVKKENEDEEVLHKELYEENEEKLESSENTSEDIDFDDWPEFEFEKNSDKEEVFKENLLIRKVLDFFKEKMDFEDLTTMAFLGRLIVFIEEKGEENEDFCEKIMGIVQDYWRNLRDFYWKNEKIEYSKSCCKEKRKKKEDDNDKNHQKNKWEDTDFEEIHFHTNFNENFKKNSQVFLCYGKGISNKKLLKNYGISIEYNKYDKVFFNIFPSNFCKESEIYGKFLEQIDYFPNFQQFKLKYTSLNRNIVIFFKILMFNFEENQVNEIFNSKNIDLEIKAIEKIVKVLKGLNFGKNSLEENEKLLFDRKIGYNQYFSVVYKLEKQRITQFNINLFDICLIMLKKIQKGFDKIQVFSEKIESEENEEEFQRNRYVLLSYMKKWEF